MKGSSIGYYYFCLCMKGKRIRWSWYGIAAVWLLSACQHRPAHNDPGAKPAAATETVEFARMSRLSLTGDFDGNGVMDTLYQHCISTVTGREIDSFPYSAQDSMANYFRNLESSVFLSSRTIDTLGPIAYSGGALGLYCLINIGNVDHHKGDEVALVIDYADWSSLNSCKIYSHTSDGWKQTGEFEIFEGAFQHMPGDTPVRDYIPGFLEKESGKWYYKDYMKEDGNMEMTSLVWDSVRVR